jgi:hypothetical protein
VTRLARLAPAAAALVAGALLDATEVDAIACGLPADHPLGSFFAEAVAAGGLSILRV